MAVHRRLAPMLTQFDFGAKSLLGRLAGCWTARLRNESPVASLVGASERSLDFDMPFIEIVWRVNEYLIHRGVGIALPRDFWQVRNDD